MEGQIPAVITPEDLLKILGTKSPTTLAKIPIPRCRLYNGSKKYVYLGKDLIAHLEAMIEAAEIDLDL